MKLISALVLSAALFGAVACSDTSKESAAASQNGTAVAPASAAPAAEGTAVALNPAHGLPGHRCDIEVGAPLNSAPQTQQNFPQPNLKPLPVTGRSTPSINPPHGEPGHDCAVPVGQPLTK